MPPQSSGRFSRAEIIAHLAPTLGEEKSLAMWEEARDRLGIAAGETYTHAQVVVVFDALGATPGLVGVAARYARIRLDYGPSRAAPLARASQPDLVVSNIPSSGPSGASSLSGAPGDPSDPVALADLVALLAPTLGNEKAMESVVEVAKTLGLSTTQLTRAGALSILDAMAQVTGLPGVVARFGRARFMLRCRS